MTELTAALREAIKAGNSQETERLLAQFVDLEEDNRIHRSVLDAMSEGWWSWEVKTGATRQNHTWFHMLGYDPAHFTPSLDTWVNLMHPDDREYAQAEQLRLSWQQDQWELLFRMKAADGQYHWILSSGMVSRRAENGEPLELVGTHRDLTFEHGRQTLVTQEGNRAPLFQMILGINPGAIKIYDYIRQRIVYSARLNEMVFGDAEPHKIGLKQQQIYAQLHPEDRAILARHEAQMRKVQDGEIVECYFRVMAPDGNYVWLWLRDTVFKRNEDGDPIQLLGSLNDITSYQLLEQQLKKSLVVIEDLAHANSHELRAPIANLLGLVDLMQEQIPLSKPATELLSYMHQTIGQLDQIIYDVMQRIEESRGRNAEG